MKPLSAKGPGISPAEKRALQLVRDKLASGELKHAPDLALAKGDGFNMYFWHQSNGCGTICCIGGWADSFADGDFNARRYALGGFTEGGLWRLFFDGSAMSRKTTPAQAVSAIDNFLATGEPKWDEVLGGKG